MLRGRNYMILNSATVRSLLTVGLNTDVFKLAVAIEVIDVQEYTDSNGEQYLDEDGLPQLQVEIRRVDEINQPKANGSKKP